MGWYDNRARSNACAVLADMLADNRLFQGANRVNSDNVCLRNRASGWGVGRDGRAVRRADRRERHDSCEARPPSLWNANNRPEV